jgi:uncharacterized zinc-type alcohol dehydrogenase-like protein
MSTIRAWAAPAAGAPFEPFEFEAGPLGPEQVEIAVEHCGVCHTDLTLLENGLGVSRYPLVLGHEAVGRVVALGEHAKGLQIGQRVGVGFMAESCMHCHACLGGDQHLCPTGQSTIIGRHGGFAERVRVHWGWAVPVPDALPAGDVGPLLCAGVTVVAPLLALGIGPTQRLGVVGIGGLGHLALKFFRAWGCEVTAFTSSESKREEARALGAHRVVSSRDRESMRAIAGSLDFILDTINVPMDWEALRGTLAPKGRLHIVGGLSEPLPITNVFGMMQGHQAVSGSLVGSRGATDTMLAFAARHGIAPQTEHFPMSRINDAFDHLRSGKARYRVVLDADFAS